ncbi:MAG TPA: 4Fe-4S ferredoxin [Solibacterales bacterium]|nr:4Fe-4S ferredoxin [Bryobacterales bacterium]
MTATGKQDKGTVTINPEECKGCALCVDVCTQKGLHLAGYLNHNGYHPAVYQGHGCNGCGLCFYVCPEPGAIVVYKRAANPRPKAVPVPTPA